MTEGEPGAIDFTLDLVGVTLDGRWRIESELGRGGMGTVYRAEDLRLARPVVVKVPHPKFLAEEGFLQRFDREIRSLLTLEHPHIVKVHDVGAYRGVPFAVLQFLPGGSLADRMPPATGPLSPEAVLVWLPSVAGALDYVHARGVVHRDVKPGNVLFDEAGHAFLADFGIAKALGGVDTGLTQTGMTPGSPSYMAPETVVGSLSGPKADQYALASLVYEALSGRVPFGGSTAIEVLVAKQMTPAPPLSSPNVPPAAAAAVMRALERDPAARFENCSAFSSAFVAGLSAAHSVRASGTTATRPLVSLPAPAPAPVPAPAPGPTARSNKGRGALVTAVVLLALGGAAFAAWGVGLFDEDRPHTHARDVGTKPPESIRGLDPVPSPPPPSVPTIPPPPPPPSLPSPPPPSPANPSATADVTPPFFEAVHPASGSFVAATEATVSLKTEPGSTVTIGGVAATEGEPGAFSATVPLPIEGRIRIAIAATDRAGNAAALEITLRRDTLAPAIRVTTPAKGLYVSGRTCVIEGTADDAKVVTFRGIPADVGADGKFTVTLPIPSEGEHIFAYTGSDRAGNATSGSVTVVCDRTPPVVTLEEPTDGAEVPAGPVLVRGRVVDKSPGVVRVNGAEVPYADGRFEGRAAVHPSALSLKIQAEDAAGNASEPRFVAIARAGVAKPRSPGLSPRPGASGALPEFTLDKDPTVTLVLVPAGDFVAGPASGDASAKGDEGKSRTVKVPAFLVAKTEVTWAQWERFRAATKREGPVRPEREPAENPASGIAFADAKAWCDWAGLRLPTEEEWERAARGRLEGSLFAWGNEVPPKRRAANLSDEAWRKKSKSDLGGEYWFGYDDGHVGAAPVASFSPNGFGLFDVTGNVWEWCADPYNPREPSGKRVLRGGGFDSRRADCRLSRRNPQDPAFHSETTGFRPAGG